MKYTIVSIDDSRAEYKAKIRKEMSGVEEIFVECFDARPLDIDLCKELSDRGLRFADFWLNLQWKRGDIGGFISHFNTWKWCVENVEPLLIFEDDAIIPDGFLKNIESLMTEVPKDWGVVSWCVNDYGQGFYNKKVYYDKFGQHHKNRPLHKNEKNLYDYGAERMTRAYQSWTLTSALYSPLGAKALVSTAQDMGLHMNADAFVFHRAHCGDFDAYAPKPQHLDLVATFNEGHSLIQENEF
jgi:GR25 family glycosyltransferase involved in LPS biosynthesis